MGFGVWEGLQWIGNGCGLQMDGFSAHFKQYASISVDFHDFGHFAFVSDGLALFSEGPRTLRDCPGGPGTLRAVSQGPETFREQRQTTGNDSKMTKIMKIDETGLRRLEMG